MSDFKSEFFRTKSGYDFYRPAKPQFSDCEMVKLFGVVFHDTRHAFVKKMLEGKVFQVAMDSISGKKWEIHAVGMSVDDQTVAEQGIKRLFKTFGLDDHFDRLPFFAILSETKSDQNQYHRLFIPISDNDPDESYRDLRAIITTVTKTIEKIDPKNYGNIDEIFHLVEMEFVNKKFGHTIRSTFSFAAKIKEILGM